jgi:hypothetical protein
LTGTALSRVWDLDTANHIRTLPVITVQLIGFDAYGELLVSDRSGVNIWNIDDGHHDGPIPLAGGPEDRSFSDGEYLTAHLASNIRFPLDPRQWFARICAVQHRGYTQVEKSALPPGADSTPPCAEP